LVPSGGIFLGNWRSFFQEISIVKWMSNQPSLWTPGSMEQFRVIWNMEVIYRSLQVSTRQASSASFRLIECIGFEELCNYVYWQRKCMELEGVIEGKRETTILLAQHI
jgi:hypothetical protein